MSAPVSVSVPLPASVEQAAGLLKSEAWIARKGEALGDGSRVVRREEHADGSGVMETARDLPDGVPGALEKFLPQDGKVVQTETWQPVGADGVGRGTWKVLAPGVPGEISGTVRLEPAASGCTYTVEGAANVKIPLIGRRVEKMLAGLVEKLARKEADVMRSELTRA